MLKLVPTWAYGIAAALALASSFGAGFRVASWRCEAAKLDAVQRALKRAEDARDKIQQEATNYEHEREQGRLAADQREQAVRTIYRNVEVPGECAAPSGVRGVLDEAVRAANGSAGSEPSGRVPRPSLASADPARS